MTDRAYVEYHEGGYCAMLMNLIIYGPCRTREEAQEFITENETYEEDE